MKLQDFASFTASRSLLLYPFTPMPGSKSLFPLTLIALSSFVSTGCTSKAAVQASQQKVTVGMVHYQPIESSDIQLGFFEEKIERQLPSVDVQITGTTNYERGAELICEEQWDISFALSPIVSAQAIECGHIPLFQAYGGGTYRSAIFVRSDSPLAENFSLKNLADKSLALNQIGSASGFYFPLHTLWGATLSKVGLLGDYDKIKSAVMSQEYDIGVAPDVLIADDTLFPPGSFTVVARSIDIPKGVIFISPRLSKELRQQLEAVLRGIKPELLPKGGNDEPLYDATAPLPSFDGVVEVIKTIEAIGDCYSRSPAQIKQCDKQADK